MWVRFLLGSILVALGIGVYFPALHGAWLWDDPQYVTANPLLNDPARLWKVWFAPGSTMEFYPLQETALALQWRWWGSDPFPYHLTNVLLHVLSALLLWRVFAQLGLRFAWAGSVIFLLHPVNVESVAWITELKNTLSLPPFLLAISAFLRFDESRRPRDYLLSLACFTCALLVKISMAPFAFVILLFSWWKRGQVEARDLRVAAPFLGLALLLSGLTVFAYVRFGQSHPQHPVIPEIGGPEARLSLAILTTSFYFARALWPASPIPMYPQWPADSHFAVAALLACLWLALLGGCWRARRGWGRHALLGLGFFLLMIAPFCGLATQSYMYFAWVMDHFLYIPMIGLIGLVLAGWQDLADRSSVARFAAPLALAAWMLVSGGQTHAYASQWASGARLWAYAISKNPAAWLAHYNLGNAARQDGDISRAISAYQTSLRLRPGFDWSHDNLGICLASSGQLPDAIAEYRAALRLRADFPEAHSNLGNALTQSGDLNGAIAEFHAALASRPALVAARYNLALALIQAGRIVEAADELHTVLRTDPTFTPARVVLQGLK